MDQVKINRINELARKKKTIGLTKKELEEQKQLREEYLSAIRTNFKATLNSIKVKDKDGNIRSLKQ